MFIHVGVQMVLIRRMKNRRYFLSKKQFGHLVEIPKTGHLYLTDIRDLIKAGIDVKIQDTEGRDLTDSALREMLKTIDMTPTRIINLIRSS